MGDIGQTMLRVSAVATAFGLIALVDRDDRPLDGRRRSASLFGYLILFEGVIAGFRPSIQGWLLVRAGGVVVSQSPDRGLRLGRLRRLRSDQGPAVLMSVARADVVLGAYVVALLVARARRLPSPRRELSAARPAAYTAQPTGNRFYAAVPVPTRSQS